MKKEIKDQEWEVHVGKSMADTPICYDIKSEGRTIAQTPKMREWDLKNADTIAALPQIITSLSDMFELGWLRYCEGSLTDDWKKKVLEAKQVLDELK